MNFLRFLIASTLVLILPLFAEKTSNLSNQSEVTRMKLLANGEIASWHLICCQTCEKYLKNIDQGNYEQGWQFCDPLLQQAMHKNEWQRDLQAAKFYLGEIQSRSLINQRITWDPPGMPEGPYIVMEYDSQSKRSSNLSEVVTLRKNEGAKWLVMMYQVNELQSN